MKKSISWLDLIQTVAIVFGIGFGVLELSSFRAERSQTANLELASFLMAPEIHREFSSLVSLPDGASAEEVVDHFQGNENFLTQYGMLMETVGVLVWRGDLDIRFVDDLMGGGTIMFWEKTHAYWELWREQMNRPATMEWTQWLAERLEELDTGEQLPAYEAFADWTPK